MAEINNITETARFIRNFNQNFRGAEGFDDIISRLMQEATPQQTPASREVVENLPIVTISETHCQPDSETKQLKPPSWSICLDEISRGTNALFMPCGHAYHPDWIKQWLDRNNTWPICRKELPSKMPDQNTNTDNNQEQNQEQN